MYEAKPVEVTELSAEQPHGHPLLAGRLDLIKDLRVTVDVVVGRTRMSVEELFALREDSIVSLDTLVEEPLEVLVDGKLVARGTLVAVEDSFGVRITEIAPVEPV